MKKWGILITIVYAVIVGVLIVPGLIILGGEWPWEMGFGQSYLEGFTVAYQEWWMTWVWVGTLVGGQVTLLLVSVDTSWRRLKPRQHIFVSAGVAAALFGLLSFAAIWSIWAAAVGDGAAIAFDPDNGGMLRMLACWIGLWLLWGVVFFLYLKRTSRKLDRLVGWLLKGSVLELLVAVPCHVIVRCREDCSAPIATGFGITTGLAIMLLSFGPGVLFLYKKRMERYGAKDRDPA